MPTTENDVKGNTPAALSNLLGMSKLMVAQSDLGELLSLIMSEATRLMSAERSSLFLMDESGEQLTSFIAQKSEVSEIRLPVGQGISGTVASTGEIINLEDAYESDLFDSSWDEKTGFRTRSVLCVPMLNIDRKIVGVLQVLNKADGHFDEADETMLAMFASHGAVAIENLRLHEDLKLVFLSGIRALAQSVDARDATTAGHSERVTCYAVRIAEAMGLSPEDITKLEYAATLHDVGKIAVPDAILGKEGKLTDEEFEIMKSHAASTREILDKFYFTGPNADVPFIAAAHHERLNGSGYPDGLLGDDLPLLARILAVADVYDAVTSYDRPYRRAMTPEQGIELLRGQAGTLLDENVIDVFVANELYKIERRRFARIDMNVTIEFRILPRDRFDGARGGNRGHTLDISDSGLRFIADDFVPVGSYLEAVVRLEGEELDVLAKVVRIERVGRSHQFEVSIGFLRSSAPMDERLKRYLVSLVAA